MQRFEFLRPRSLPEALGALSATTLPLAGSTELLNWMRLGIAAPKAVVDISRLGDLAGIELGHAELRIGALSTLNDVGESTLVVAHATALSQACLLAASPQIRNRATLGGNVLQKTRCGYFRSEAPLPWECNKRQPGSGCAARHGVHEQHAIFGWSDACVATQPSDPIVALAALDAVIDVAGPAGIRVIAARDFHLTPAEADPQRETRLHADELIVRYRIPLRSGARSSYVKVRERQSFAYATVSAAAQIELAGDRIVHASLALGSVAAKPWRLFDAEKQLLGCRLDRQEIHAIVAAAMQHARPLEHNHHKVTIATHAAVRAVTQAGART